MDKREIAIEMECDSDIASDAIAISHWEEWVGDIKGANIYCDLRSRKSQQRSSIEAQYKGANNAATTSDSDIVLEGGQCDQRMILMNGKGFYEGISVLMHRKREK